MLLEDSVKGRTLVPVEGQFLSSLFHLSALHFNCSACLCTLKPLTTQQTIHHVLEKVAEFESVPSAQLSSLKHVIFLWGPVLLKASLDLLRSALSVKLLLSKFSLT